MNTKLIFQIARSLLLARWRQTLVAAVGVTFSITMFIALLGFMTGLNVLLDGLILNRTAHVRLYKEVRPSPVQPIQLASEYNGYYNFIQSVKSGNSREDIFNSKAIMRAIGNDPRVLGFTPKITTPVFFNDGAVEIAGMLTGIKPEAENVLFHFSEYMVAGASLDLNSIPNSIVLGKDLAEKLLVQPGDLVQVTTTKGERFSLKVSGLYQTGIRDLDKTISFTSIKTAQKILGKPSDYFTDIQVKLHNLKQAPEVAKAYRSMFQTDAEDIQTANAQFETGSFIRTLISYAVGITLLVVAGFGIYNILNMMIYEKMDTIAILKATGFSGKDVNRIFIGIALSIGIFGGLLGLLFGFLLSLGIDQIPFNTPSLPTVKTYPINYDPAFYLIGITFSLITTYMAGLFPARKASKVDPVVIIRGK